MSFLSLDLVFWFLIFIHCGQVAVDCGALSLDKVFEIVGEGEKLPVDVNEELKVRGYLLWQC